jgi:tetratricopeptide (TPR) repeat protein
MVVKKPQNFRYYLAALVSLLTFIIYLSSLGNDFVNWDDNSYVLENSHIRSLNMAFFRWAFLNFYADNWHPLTWMSHAFDYAIWGLNPVGHHLTNIILHAINSFIVVLLILRLIETLARYQKNGQLSFFDSRTALLTAGITGLLFGLHPLHVESVAWIAERKDLLCALFFLLSIMAYTKYVTERSVTMPGRRFRNRHYLLTLSFIILALLSKPMAVSLPAVLLILDWYPFKRIRSLKTFWTAFVEKLPVIVLCLISSVLTVLAQKAGGTVVPIEAIPLSTRVLVAAKSLIIYLGKMILPLNLIPYYPYPSTVSLSSLEYLSAIVIVIGITVFLLLIVKKQKIWLSAWGYYLITMMPVIGIFQVGNQSIADRYTYLPSLGPFFIAGLSSAWMFKKMEHVGTWWSIAKRIFTAATLLLLISFSCLTFIQIRVWKNDLNLWNYVIKKEPESIFFAYNNRALAFYKRGQFDKAIADYDKAIELNPADEGLYNNRGMAHAYGKRYDRAIADFETAIELNPRDVSAYYNMACLYSIMNKTDEACKWFKKVIGMGYCNWAQIKQDRDLDNIRNVSCYKEVMAGKEHREETSHSPPRDHNAPDKIAGP